MRFAHPSDLVNAFGALDIHLANWHFKKEIAKDMSIQPPFIAVAIEMDSLDENGIKK